MSQKSKEREVVKREQLIWTPSMDDIFIQSMIDQQYAGNRVDGSFTPTAYANMVSELKNKLNKDFTKAHLKNRLKTLKDHFAQCYDLFRGVGLSGFSWNSETKLFEAEEEIWEQLIAAKPDAIKWKTKQIMNYNELQELFAKDRATGAASETAKEKNKRKGSTSSGNWDTIEEIDNLLSENMINLENLSYENESQYVNVTTSDLPSNSTDSKGKKRKHEDAEDMSKKIMTSLENVADVMREGHIILRESNAIMERSQQRVYTEHEIYNELEAIGLETNDICEAYLFLVKHSENARALFGCPPHMKKKVLEQMMKKGD